jgi:hypothetical protein
MRLLLSAALGLLILSVGLVSLRAQDKSRPEDKTLKGTITCAKCDLKQADKCQTVIKVKEDGKDVVYYFDPAGHKKYHGKICTSPTEGEVTGTVSKKGEKHTVKVSSVKFE